MGILTAVGSHFIAIRLSIYHEQDIRLSKTYCTSIVRNIIKHRVKQGE